MASYRDSLPASGSGASPSFQRGTFTWATSTSTTVTIPITKVNPANSFITQLRGITGASGQWDEVTFTGKLNAAGDGIEIVRSGTTAVSVVISWEVGTNPAVNVQRGVQMFSHQGEFNVTIPTISDLTKASAVLIGNVEVYITGPSAVPWPAMVSCELTASNLRLRRGATNYPVQVSWEVITYA